VFAHPSFQVIDGRRFQERNDVNSVAFSIIWCVFECGSNASGSLPNASGLSLTNDKTDGARTRAPYRREGVPVFWKALASLQVY
jgi:hypothetical protein